MLIGYARVSTDEQNLQLQLDALKKAGCKRVFTDKAGGIRPERKGLAEALSHLRENDALVVWKLDRLGRTVRGLVDLVGELEHRRVHFQSLTDGINTKTPAGRFFFYVMASLAQMERAERNEMRAKLSLSTAGFVAFLCLPCCTASGAHPCRTGRGEKDGSSRRTETADDRK